MSLMNNRPNWIIPLFRQVDFMIQYKRFPADYKWRDFIDLTDFDARMTAIEASIPPDLAATLDAMTGYISDAATAAAAAQAQADYATAAAAAVQSNLDATNAYNATQDAAIATAAAAAAAATPSNQLPNNIFIDSVQNHLVAGSSLVIGVSGSYINNHASVMLTPANGDSWDVTFLCAAGTYLLRIIAPTNLNSPKTDVYIDGNLLTTFDWYSNPAVFNVTKSVSTGALSAGRHTLKMTVNGRNALNTTGWQMPINYYLLNP